MDQDNRTNFFHRCALATSGHSKPGTGSSEAGFLRALEYDQDLSAEKLANATALLSIAARCEDCFQLPLPFAPRAFAFGAMVDPKKFGIPDHPRAGTGGRGLTFAKSFESCMGEVAEYLSFIEHASDPLLARFDERLAPPEHTLQWALEGIGLNSGTDLEQLDWIAARSLTDGTETQFPSELVLRRPESRRAGTRAAESMGVGAGITLDDAILSGLMEVVERDAVALWWYGNKPAKQISQSVIAALASDVLTARDPNAERPCWVLDIGSSTGIPVVGAFSSLSDGSSVITGFSAGFSIGDAVKGAMLELFQMELASAISLSKLDDERRDRLGDLDELWIRRHRELSRHCFDQFNPPANAPATVDHVCLRDLNDCLAGLQKNGFEAYAVELTRPDVAIPVAKVLIPGMQTAKPPPISDRLAQMAAEFDAPLDRLTKAVSPI